MKVRGKISQPAPTPHHPDEVRPGALVIDSERLTATVAGQQDAEYVSADLLHVTEKALRLVALYRPRLEPWAAAYPLSTDQARMRLTEGFHLLDAEQLDPPTELLFEILTQVVELASCTDAAVLEALREWSAGRREDPAALRELAALNVRRDRRRIAAVAAAQGLSGEAFWFVLHNLGLVLFSPLAARLAPLVDDEQWQRGSCPICGNTPAIGALVGDGGRRHLLCEACHFVWTFPRLKCPLCGNEEMAKLKVLALDDQSPHRLDVCEACHGYVKTIDYRKADPHQAMLLPVEDAATLYLDIMAGEAELQHE